MKMSDAVDLKPVEIIIDRCGTGPDAAVPILQAVQKEYRYLPREALAHICKMTDIRQSDLASISSFFPQFRRKPAGKHTVCVCDGTACHLKGAPDVYDAIAKRLGIAGDGDTDSEGLFTVQKVRCLGCCTLAPAVQIDGVTYGHVQKEHVGRMLEEFLEHDAALGANSGGDMSVTPAGAGEIRIGLGSCCVAGGSERVRRAVSAIVKDYAIDARIKRVSCVGMCHQTPLMEVRAPGQPPRVYAKVQPEDAGAIILANFAPRRTTSRLRARTRHLLEALYDGAAAKTNRDLDFQSDPVNSFAAPQKRLATEFCGEIDPLDLEEWMAKGGFSSLRKCLTLSPDAIIDEIAKSGLRGRGGAGFPTARKWREVRNAVSAAGKIIICNGDEGDPGAFMDRMILESYPFRVLEGMLIASVAVGAHRGIFYIRSEYPLAVARMRAAIEKCRDAGILGKSVLGSSHELNIEVREGAGAFVCGEESAMIASIEGSRPVPRHRPPYPAHKGLFGVPTLVNNVETLALIPWIVSHGADDFARIGTKGSHGTKVFSLAGKIRRGGLIEVPMGTTIGEIVQKIGGGVADGREFKAVQIGGPSGGCIPAELAGLAVDFDELTGAGSMMGSGGMVVLDDTDCVVEMSRYFLSFTQLESCGKCTPCRVGTLEMLEILGRLCEGRGAAADIERLRRIAHVVKSTSLCGLGKTAPNPVLTALRYFGDEFEAHARGKCPAHKCKALITFSITNECTGCTKCAQACPSGAIAMTPYEVHKIDADKCVKCGNCYGICPAKAVRVE
jgi:NADH-quinone oxidoreductase subunit F